MRTKTSAAQPGSAQSSRPSLLAKRGLALCCLGCAALGCQSMGTPGAALPPPSAGPVLMAPGSSAARTWPEASSIVTRPTNSPLPGDLPGGGRLLPARDRIEQPSRLRRVIPQPLQPVPKPDGPFQLVSMNQSETRHDSETQPPSMLSIETLERESTLAPVLTPRKRRGQSAVPAPNSQLARPSISEATPGNAIPSNPRGWSDPRIRRLPRVFESAPGLIKNRELPQKPIPLYPEVPSARSRLGEDL